MTKLPPVTGVFWAQKIIATTLGETAGDALSMSLGLGYVQSSLLLAALFALLGGLQLRARRYNPVRYWAALVATTTLGTTVADWADRTLGLGYAGGASLLLALLCASLLAWYAVEGSIAVGSVVSPRKEAFYWLTLLCSQTLGTALGDWVADTESLGYAGSACIFGGLLAATALAYWRTRLSRTALFWAAFVLTRPLGAVLGDLLDKPVAEGGLALSRFGASAALLAAMAVLMVLAERRSKRVA